MPTYNIDGQPLHVHEEGKDHERVIVLIHGWASSWYAMSPLLPYLSQHYHCLAVDLPGYGASPSLPQRVTIARYTRMIADLIEQVTTKPVILIGHSMGGMISLQMTLTESDMVERMVLLNPTISGDLGLLVNLTLAPFAALERFPLTSWLVSVIEPLINITDSLLRPALFAAESKISQDDYESIRADVRHPGQGRIRAECFWAMRENSLKGWFGQIDKPALVLWGMEDNTVPLRDASIVAREWPAADLRVIPNSGHWPQFETPDVVMKYITGFLGRPTKLIKLDFDE
jgi:pimeloyl-ACP methyl ester carboxylesterase